MPHIVYRCLTIFIFCSLVLLWKPVPAWAVQGHGDPEGLVVHLLGHLLFISGMAVLLYQSYRQRLTSGGWRFFRLFLWCILLWNLQTASGHILHEIVSADRYIIMGGHPAAFRITTFLDGYFYFTRLDHLLMVPALVLLLLALRQWRNEE